MKNQFKIAIFIVTVGPAIALVISNCAKPRVLPAQSRSENALRQFAIGLRYFLTDGQESPEKLSTLYPEFINKKGIFFINKKAPFFAHYTDSPDLALRDIHEARLLIDNFFSYRMTVADESTIYLYEQPGIWPDGSFAYLKLEKQGDEWNETTSVRLPASDLQRFQKKVTGALLQSQYPELLEP